MIITDSKTGKKYWLAMRSPNNLRVGDTSEEYNTLINDLRLHVLILYLDLL